MNLFLFKEKKNDHEETDNIHTLYQMGALDEHLKSFRPFNNQNKLRQNNATVVY